MTKVEAIRLMEQGKKVTHRYFSPNEFATIKDGQIVTEEGYSVPMKEFWAYRNVDGWNDGWEEFVEKKATPSPSGVNVLLEALEKVRQTIIKLAHEQTTEFEKNVRLQNAGSIHIAMEIIEGYKTHLSQSGAQLVWKDGKTLIFDTTVLFSKSYNFEGLELMAQETKTPIGRVVIWPDKLGQGKKWAFYFEYDGWLKQDFDSEDAVKNAVAEAVKKEISTQSLSATAGSQGEHGHERPIEAVCTCHPCEIHDGVSLSAEQVLEKHFKNYHDDQFVPTSDKPIKEAMLDMLRDYRIQSTLPSQTEDTSYFRGEVIGTIAYDPIRKDLKVTVIPDQAQSGEPGMKKE